ncbi:hypothetical protein Hanom_Chr02g00128221 [Helianthus anomalus]
MWKKAGMVVLFRSGLNNHEAAFFAACRETLAAVTTKSARSGTSVSGCSRHRRR